jgi:AcrR family transcriptional regulator
VSVTDELEREAAGALRGGLTAEERSADRRRRVLDAALELFGTRGYAAVPVDRICRTAGISTKSFYPLFDNKEALFSELYDELVSKIAVGVVAAPVEGLSVRDAVTARLDALVHAAVDDPRVARVVLIESAGLSPVVEERRRAVHNSLATFVVQTTAQFVDKGELPDRDYRRASLGLVGAINELIIDYVLSEDLGMDGSIDTLVSDLRDLFLAVRRGLELDVG